MNVNAVAVQSWSIELMLRCGIKMHVFADGTIGLIDVPAKYADVLDVMILALVRLAEGEGLPEFAVDAPKKKRRKADRHGAP